MFNKSRCQIHNIDYSGADPRIVSGCVTILSNEPANEMTIIQAVTAKVRIKNDIGMTVEDLHEALFQKAVSQLKATLETVEGKTAKQMQTMMGV